jgi:hypothetical protein
MEELFITIPCKTADKPDRVTPIYVTRLNPDGTMRGRWLCAYCKQVFHRRKPCCGHMGLIADRKHNCSVLHKEDEERKIK